MRSDWIELGPIRWREMESRLGEMRSDQLCYALQKFRERERERERERDKGQSSWMELMVLVFFFFFLIFFCLSQSYKLG
jgi:hypothetical protein